MSPTTQEQDQPPTQLPPGAHNIAQAPNAPARDHAAADAERAMSRTAAWKPATNRRQSWSKEDHKHALQMGHISDVRTGPGFTEEGKE